MSVKMRFSVVYHSISYQIFMLKRFSMTSDFDDYLPLKFFEVLKVIITKIIHNCDFYQVL